MKCKDFREIVDSYLSDELLTETNHDVIRHMESCSDCRSVIEARREIRVRLKNAVLGSPEHGLPEGFNHRMMAQLRNEVHNSESASTGSWFGFRNLAFAASLLIVAMFGIMLYPTLSSDSDAAYRVAALPATSLVNIASGDHQHCAIEHDLEEPPVNLASADSRYRDLDQVVVSKISNALPDHKLAEAHACKYKDVRFAHIVMEGQGKTVSVLVTREKGNETAIGERIGEYESDSYRIATFKVGPEKVFVISDHPKETNTKAADTLARPLRDLLSRDAVQTAMIVRSIPPFPQGYFAEQSLFR